MKVLKRADRYLGKRYLSDDDRSNGACMLQSKFPNFPFEFISHVINDMDNVIAINYTPFIVLKYNGKRYDVVYHDGNFIWMEFMSNLGYLGTIDELVEFVMNTNPCDQKI